MTSRAVRRPVLIDDRLLIELMVGSLPSLRNRALATTSYWYYRACRAAVAGGGGHLSGPFEQLPATLQQRAILNLLQLPTEVALADQRRVVPAMAELSLRHPRLNLLNLEAIAAALTMGAEVRLSQPGAAGVLPEVLEAEGIRWFVLVIE